MTLLPQGETIWVMAGDGPTSFGESPDYTFTQHNIDGFSEFALGGNIFDNPLSLEWLSMNLSQTNGIIYLDWQTANQTNNHYFSVLPMALIFSNWGRFPVQIIGSHVSSYTFADHNPLSGIDYYRITQTDFDGTNSHSKVLVWQNQTTNEPAILVKNQQIYSRSRKVAPPAGFIRFTANLDPFYPPAKSHQAGLWMQQQ